MADTLKTIKSLLPKEKSALLKRKNVVAVGIGYKIVKGKKTDQLAIVCSVSKKELNSKLSKTNRLPKTINEIPLDVVESGVIQAFQNPKEKFRPVPGGVSVGHYAITAGTLGLWIQKDDAYHILSNNHVLADSNSASLGDSILQPGPYDGGTESIAKLSGYIPIHFDGNENLVDAALAQVYIPSGGTSKCPIASAVAKTLNFGAAMFGSKTRLQPMVLATPDNIVKNEILNVGKPTGYMEATLGTPVIKMGRTTGLTEGEIEQIDVTVQVSYGSGKVAVFTDQIMAGAISAGGDSGSVVLDKDEHRIVGLLFAGSDTTTVINRFSNVWNALNIPQHKF